MQEAIKRAIEGGYNKVYEEIDLEHPNTSTGSRL